MSDQSSNVNHPTGPHSAPGGLAGGDDNMGDLVLQSLHERLMREKEEPGEGFSLIPIFLIFLLCVLVYLNGIYVATHSGAFHGDVFDDNWKPGEGGVAMVDPVKAGGAIFKQQCMSCHGIDGHGQPNVYPPLAGSPFPVGNPARPISILLAGMGGPINVLGNTYSSATMPAVGAYLSDKQVAYVLTYVRASFGNNDVPVDDAEVTQIRADLGKRAAWTPDELLKLYPLGAPAPAAPAGAAPAGTAPAAATFAGTTPASAGPAGTSSAAAPAGTAPAATSPAGTAPAAAAPAATN